MNVADAIRTRRTIRRFQRMPVEKSLLVTLVDLARLGPAAANLQPLEYIIVDEDGPVDECFSLIRLAALLSDEERPTFDERPSAYIVILVNTRIMKSGYQWDVGAAGENIMLEATARGLGSCFVVNVDREGMTKLLSIPKGYAVDAVIALGHPAERAVAIDTEGEDTRYYREPDGTHMVPKRKLSDVMHTNRF
ncbi:MAG: nitroreductase family protein [Deltaproteobacteria bacterium]|nr:nitroreductase family protein [Candidatus Zymogenaceae bacterium]